MFGVSVYLGTQACLHVCSCTHACKVCWHAWRQQTTNQRPVVALLSSGAAPVIAEWNGSVEDQSISSLIQQHRGGLHFISCFSLLAFHRDPSTTVVCHSPGRPQHASLLFFTFLCSFISLHPSIFSFLATASKNYVLLTGW